MMQLFRADRADLIARPMSIFTITATGNFRYSEDSCQNLIDCVEAGVPVEIVPVTLMGLIAPVTTVGATVFHTVDVLAGITMAQVIRPGAPVLFGGAPATFHMKIASSPMSAIEALQLDAAYVAVAKSLGPAVPVVHGPVRRADPRRAGRRRDVRQRADRRARRRQLRVRARACSTSCWCSTCRSSSSTTRCAARRCASCARSRPVDDLPVGALIDQLMADQHLIMAEHTMAHWPTELYLPSAIVDRDNRENWPRPAARTRTSGRSTRSTGGWRRTGRPRRIRRSTPSCAGSSGPGSSRRPSCRSSRRRPSRRRRRWRPPRPATAWVPAVRGESTRDGGPAAEGGRT